ncbi:MAG: site-specific integrase, partial [Cyanobacteria bacterium REEB65]|nr:site-specific integrase [Cyanobacteria bacterium REEB65]
ANRMLALISVVFSHAIDEHVIDGPNPASGIERNEEVKRSRRILPTEMARFLTAVEAEPNQTIRDYVLLSLYGAARRSNVLAMEWAEIDLEGLVWHVPGSKTKNGDQLDVPLEPEEIEILERRKEAARDCPWVFPGTGKTGHLVEPKAGWKRIRDRAGMHGLRLHDLRRTNASYQADEGASPLVIGRAIGDKSPAAVAVYTRVDLDPVRAAKRRALDAIKRDRERQDGAATGSKEGGDA